MDIAKHIKEEKIPDGQYIVVGSGIMNALGIRESDDIDLVITPELYEELKSTTGWEEIKKHDYYVLLKGPFEAGVDWDSPSNQPNLEELKLDSTVVDGVTYTSLNKVRTWKQKLGRDKDKKDLILIDEYLKTQK